MDTAAGEPEPINTGEEDSVVPEHSSKEEDSVEHTQHESCSMFVTLPKASKVRQ